MPNQVAEVYADLKFRVQGTGDVTSGAQSVQKAMADVQKAATSASAEVRVAGQDLQDSIQGVAAAAREMEAAKAQITAAGESVESMAEGVRQAGAEIQNLEARMAGLGAGANAVHQAIEGLGAGGQEMVQTFIDTARAAEAAGNSIEANVSTIAKITGESEEAVRAYLNMSKALEGITSDLETVTKKREDDIAVLKKASGAEHDRALAAMEKERRALHSTARRAGDTSVGFDEVRDSARGMNGALALNQTTMRGVVSSLRSGRVSSTLFAGGLRGVVGALSSVSIGAIAAAAALAAMVAVPIFVIGKLAKDIGSIGREAALVPPQINAISDSIGNLAGVTQSQLNRALDSAITKFQSLGAAMPDRAAATTAQLGGTLQFLSPGAFDAEESIAAVNQAIQNLDASPLAIFGQDVGELNEMLNQLAEDGVSAADRAAVIAAASMDHLANNMAAVEAQAERERNSIQGVAMDFRAMIDAAANSEQVREVFERLGTAMRDLLPAIVPVIKAAVDAFVAVGNILSWVIEKISAVINWFEELGITIEEVAKTALRSIPLIGFPLEKLLGMLGDTTEQGNDLEEQLAEIGKGLDLDEFLRGLGDADIAFAGIEDSADRAKTAVEQFSETTSTMRGFQGQIMGIVQSFGALKDSIDPGEVTNFVGSLAGALDFIGQRGAANVRASLEAEAELLKQFFEEGLLSVKEYERGLEELEAKQTFADPIIRKVEEMEAGLGNTQTAAQNATGAVQTVISSLNSLDGTQVGANIHIGVTGPGAALLGGGFGGGGISGFVGLPQPRVPPGSGVSGITTAAPGTVGGPPIVRRDSSASIGADRGLINRAKEIEAENNRRNLDDLFDKFGTPPSGGGGGGGGGSAGASIEEIREFFRQVNAVIMSGIRGGKIFSTAGNAIPVGAPGEFLNTKGGALIQTVNIRGVWDFADPAAKRQIIKELEESLAGLKREVA